jgi:hypothetical protein
VERDLEVGDPVAAVRPQIVLVQVGTGPHLHPRHQFLTHALVGDAEDLHVGDVGVPVQELLHLAGTDVLAPADHQSLMRPTMST